MTIRVGMIGAGRMGQPHLQSLASFPEVQVAAICDSHRSLAEAAARPFGANVHINFRTMLEAGRLDAVFVCIPPSARGEPETAAARAGIHLFLERPVAMSVEKARQIQKEIEKAGVVVAVAYPWRYLSGAERAKELLRDKRVAAVHGVWQGPVPADGWRRKRESSGGQMLVEATDLLDLARYFGGEMAAIFAVQFQGLVAAHAGDYDIEDAMGVLIRFCSGAIGQILSTDVSPRHESALTVLGEDLEMRLTSESLEVVEPGKKTVLQHLESGLASCHRAFFEAVKSDNAKLLRASYPDAVRSLEVALAARMAAETGEVVNL